MKYNFEEERVKKFLEESRACKVAVQLPSGLKRYWPEIARTVHSAGAEPIFIGNCYGGCDLADAAAKNIGCDVLVHYGHADVGIKTALPVLYIEARVVGCKMESLARNLNELRGKRIGVLTTVQFIEYIPSVKEMLKENGFEPLVGTPGSRTRYRGQILGCDFTCAKSIKESVDEYLYIGSGEFHPLGASIATGKRVIAFDPISSVGREIAGVARLIARRKAVISKAAMGKNFGVITSVKPGQCRLAAARNIVKELENNGKKAEVVILDDITPEALVDYCFDCLVCVACPRIPIDDQEKFEIPILTPWEVGVMLGQSSLEPYQMDEFNYVLQPTKHLSLNR